MSGVGGLGGGPLGGARRAEGEDAPAAPPSVNVGRTPDQLGCAMLPDRTYAIVAIAKRTYTLRLEPSPRLELADVQVPVRDFMDLDLQTGELRDDGDMLPQKPGTDVVVRGSAHAGALTKDLLVAVAVGDVARQLRVIGERRVEIRADGQPSFTSPEPFKSIELGDAIAYGGYDEYAQDALNPLTTDQLEQWQRKPPGLYQYPRNPSGRAYFIDVDRARVDGAKLPLIEDPADALSPERFFVPTSMRWIDAPITARLGWVHPARYPRLGRIAQARLAHDPPERPIRESLFRDGDDLADLRTCGYTRPMPRVLQGASPGLAGQRLRGDELVILKNLHETARELRFNLPGEAPRMSIRPPGLRSVSLSPVLNTLRIEPDLGRVSLTWCGSFPTAASLTYAEVAAFEREIAWSRLIG